MTFLFWKLSSILLKNWISKKELLLIPPRNLWVTPGDSLVHFFRWPYEYLSYLTLICKLPRDGSVLEIGCHHGRTAIALEQYLVNPGRYEGFDILKKQIDWARDHFDADRFHFTLADIFNGMYNPGGKIKPENFLFPYQDNTFDVVYAASIYTHLLPDIVKHYFEETSRVLKPKGRALFSFCLTDYYRGVGSTFKPELYELSYKYKKKQIRVKDMQNPELLIGYPLRLLSEYARVAGLKIKKVFPGYWSNNSKIAINEQDLILLTKPQ